jgi:cystathionine beta-lyase
MNVLSMHALMGAYSASGEDWVGALTGVLRGNAEYAVSYINGHFPGVWTAMPEGTYMLFLDCTGNLKQTGRSMDELLKAGWDVGVGWQDGRDFEGPCHIRLNLALPRTKLEEAMERLRKYVF